jgi:hypothetical protein
VILQKTKRIWQVAVVVAALTSVASLSHAKGPGCQADATSLCSDAGDRSERIECLIANKDKVSDTCREKIESGTLKPSKRSGAARLGPACSESIKQSCPDLGPDASRKEIVSCLSTHTEELAPKCAKRIGVKKTRKHTSKKSDDACADDVALLCHDLGADPPRHEKIMCLKSNRGDLSRKCKATLYMGKPSGGETVRIVP